MKRATFLNRQEFLISECLIGTFKAACDLCDKQDTIESFDVDGASVAFYNNGWRARENNVLLCRRCRARKASDGASQK